MSNFLDNLKAKLPAEDQQNVKCHDDKELVRRLQVVAYSPGEAKDIRRRNARNARSDSEYHNACRPADGFTTCVDVRLYMGRSASASTVYCDIWLSNKGRWLSGSGQAGGYGYCKLSAAMDSALRSCGVELSQSISGVGDSAMRAAAEACARALGYRLFTIV